MVAEISKYKGNQETTTKKKDRTTLNSQNQLSQIQNTHYTKKPRNQKIIIKNK